jgi:hypothetical protein
MKSKTISKTTTNRGEFNRAYKFYLEQCGKIRCSYCGYHHNENSRGRGYYGGYVGDNIKHPNWKLVSKQPKQWMKKPMKIVEQPPRWYGSRTYIDITW